MRSSLRTTLAGVAMSSLLATSAIANEIFETYTFEGEQFVGQTYVIEPNILYFAVANPFYDYKFIHVADGVLSVDEGTVLFLFGAKPFRVRSYDVSGAGKVHISYYGPGVYFPELGMPPAPPELNRTVDLSIDGPFMENGGDYYADYIHFLVRPGASLTLDNFVLAWVPEPSTWAAMILGFGVAGSALRRRAAAA